MCVRVRQGGRGRAGRRGNTFHALIVPADAAEHHTGDGADDDPGAGPPLRRRQQRPREPPRVHLGGGGGVSQDLCQAPHGSGLRSDTVRMEGRMAAYGVHRVGPVPQFEQRHGPCHGSFGCLTVGATCGAPHCTGDRNVSEPEPYEPLPVPESSRLCRGHSGHLYHRMMWDIHQHVARAYGAAGADRCNGTTLQGRCRPPQPPKPNSKPAPVNIWMCRS